MIGNPICPELHDECHHHYHEAPIHHIPDSPPQSTPEENPMVDFDANWESRLFWLSARLFIKYTHDYSTKEAASKAIRTAKEFIKVYQDEAVPFLFEERV